MLPWLSAVEEVHAAVCDGGGEGGHENRLGFVIRGPNRCDNRYGVVQRDIVTHQHRVPSFVFCKCLCALCTFGGLCTFSAWCTSHGALTRLNALCTPELDFLSIFLFTFASSDGGAGGVYAIALACQCHNQASSHLSRRQLPQLHATTWLPCPTLP